MKKQRIIFYTLLVLGATALEACFDSPGTDLLLNNPSSAQVEIQESGTATGLVVSKQYARLNDNIPKKDSIRINLIGPQRSTPVNVTFVIDATSTAVAGFHYTLVTTGGAVTIPANKSFAYIRYNVNADKVNAGETWNLKFNLTGGDVKVSTLYGTFTRAIRIACPFSRANFVGLFDTNEPMYGHYDNTFTADGVDPNAVSITNFWDSGGLVKYVFNPASPTVTLPSQDCVMGGTTFVVAGTATLGTYDACTYTWSIPYTVRRKSDNALFDNNVHTYTKK